MQVIAFRTIGLLCLLLAVVALPVGAAEEPSAAKPAAEKPETPAAEPEKEPDPFAVPDGNAEELFEYIDHLQKARPEGRVSRREYMEFVAKGQGALLEATEKILSADPTDEQFTRAARLKLGALEVLSQLNLPGTRKTLRDFVDQLQKAGKKELARTGQRILLSIKARRPGSAKAMRKLLAEAKEFLSGGPVTRDEASLMLAVGRSLERSDNPKLAAEAYRSFASMLVASKDDSLAGLAEKFTGAARRLALPGNPILIEGFTPDGKKFDWAEFRKGNVVLVDFWATWCGWCIREIPEMRELYEAYHDRGFEIVGLSADDDPETLREFLDETEVPWTILYGKDAPSPTIAYYGISGFPTMLLVDKKGDVVSLHARGPELRRQLRELLGPMEMNEDGEADAGEAGKRKGKAEGKKARRAKAADQAGAGE